MTSIIKEVCLLSGRRCNCITRTIWKWRCSTKNPHL